MILCQCGIERTPFEIDRGDYYDRLLVCPRCDRVQCPRCGAAQLQGDETQCFHCALPLEATRSWP